MYKRFVSYEQSQEDIRMHFEDGSQAPCDLLIGADGIKSAVRRVLLKGLAEKSPSPFRYEDSIHPTWTGTVAYRGLVPSEALSAVAPNHRTLTRFVMVSRNLCPLVIL